VVLDGRTFDGGRLPPRLVSAFNNGFNPIPI
jgi:hypothetical protein